MEPQLEELWSKSEMIENWLRWLKLEIIENKIRNSDEEVDCSMNYHSKVTIVNKVKITCLKEQVRDVYEHY